MYRVTKPPVKPYPDGKKQKHSRSWLRREETNVSEDTAIPSAKIAKTDLTRSQTIR